MKAEQFRAQREQYEREPQVREAECAKIDIDLSLSANLERFLVLAEDAMRQGKVQKCDYEELVSCAEHMKQVLNKIDEKALIRTEVDKRAKRRELRLGS